MPRSNQEPDDAAEISRALQRLDAQERRLLSERIRRLRDLDDVTDRPTLDEGDVPVWNGSKFEFGPTSGVDPSTLDWLIASGGDGFTDPRPAGISVTCPLEFSSTGGGSDIIRNGDQEHLDIETDGIYSVTANLQVLTGFSLAPGDNDKASFTLTVNRPVLADVSASGGGYSEATSVPGDENVSVVVSLTIATFMPEGTQISATGRMLIHDFGINGSFFVQRIV